MSPRVARLACGHERWVPVDWNGTALLECRECHLHVAVVFVDGLNVWKGQYSYHDDVVEDCARAILNRWREVEPATPHLLARMAAVMAREFYARD